jgi:hypothetical protein
MSAKTWFLFKDNHHIGPFTAIEIKQRFDRGEITSNIPVWREGEAEWIPLVNQTELASFVMPTEAVELPPLPPLPEEAFDHNLPSEPTDFAPTEPISVAVEQNDVEPASAELSDKFQELEESLPRESTDADSFWQIDEPGVDVRGTAHDIPEHPDEMNQPVENASKENSAANMKTSLQEKLAAVRSRLGENVESEKTSTYADGDVRFIKEDSVEESFQTNDPIRSDQRFDGDPASQQNSQSTLDDGQLPDFMAEDSVDYLSQYAGEENEESIHPTEGELAAIQASGQFSDELSEEISQETTEPAQETPADFIDPVEVEAMAEEVESLKEQASEVEEKPEVPAEDLEQLQDATFLPEEYEDSEREYDDYYEDEDPDQHYDEESDAFDEFEAPVESATKFWIKIVAAVLVVAAIGISSSQLFFQKKKIPSLSKLSKHDARAMREVIDMETNRFRYQFAVTDDKAMNIWFGTNVPDQGILEIRIESRDKKVRSKQKIIATGKTEILGYVGRFKEVRLEEGDQLAEGEYHVTGNFKVAGTRIKVIQWLKDNTPLGKMKYFKYQRDNYKIDGTFFYSHKRGSQLKDHVASFWTSLREERSKPLLVELQKWRTLKTLSEKVLMLFRQAMELEKVTIKKVGDEFQASYAKIVAPVFQTLTLDTQALIQDDKKLLPEQVSRLEELLNLQKAFGSFVAENLDSLNNYKKLTKSIKKDLGEKASKRQYNFAGKVDAKIAELQNQLAKLGD